MRARRELEAKAADGLVPVRYEGCEMEVLGQCRVRAGSYRYKALTPKRDSIEMRDADDLYANVPVGAARLESKLEKSGALKVAMTIVGRYEAESAEVMPEQLEGRGCDRATHVVAALTTGAFHFYAEGRASVGAGARTVIGGGLEGESESSREMITEDGDEAACEKSSAGDARPPERCGALIQVEVVPIANARVAAPVCPGGSMWNGSQCVWSGGPMTGCPAGTAWDGRVCVSSAPATVAAGSAWSPSGPTFANTGGCPEGMAWIPGGTLQMGSKERDPDALPGAVVTVAGFCMDVTEVTAGAYAACVRSGRCSVDGLQCARGTYGVSGKEDHPINCVDWGQAVTYCNAVGKRLPTDDEWEYTARGGVNGWDYPWGNAEPDFQLCWSKPTMVGGTCTVGRFPEGNNPWGVQDLAGNVWEWMSSVSDDFPFRTLRGGSWSDSVPSDVRATTRKFSKPSSRSNFVGFRCARTP